jgi:hypothetical protein
MLPTADDDGMTDGDRGDYGDAEGEPSSKDVGALPGVLSPHRAMPSFATRLDLKLPTIRRDAPRPGDDDGGPMSPGRSVPVLPTPRSMSVVLGAGGEYSLPTLRYEALELRTDALGRSWIVTGTVHSMVLYFLNNPAAELRDLYSFLLVHRLILDPKVLWAFILNLLFPPQAAADLSLKR